MAAGNVIIYDSAKIYLGDGTIDWNSNALAIALVTSAYTPALTHTVYANITNELSTANGYTAGGAAATGSLPSVPAGSTPAYSISQVQWSVVTANLVARRAIIYVNATVNTIVKPLIGHFLLDATPADVTVTPGNTLTLFPGGGSVFTIGGATS